MSTVENLEIRWERLMATCRLEKHGGELRRLALAYGERGRKYHTLDHIRFCLQKLDEFKDYAQHPALVELAIWYHDAVYELSGRDNEVKSAAMFLEFARRACLPTNQTSFVYSTVLATTHKESDLYMHRDCLLMLDIDLLSLARPKKEFELDTRHLRKEGQRPSQQEEFFEMLLARKNIYYTPSVQEVYEKVARANLEHALAIA